MTIEELVELNSTFDVLNDDTGEVIVTAAEWQEYDNGIWLESTTTNHWIAVAGRDDIRYRCPDSVAVTLDKIADSWMRE